MDRFYLLFDEWGYADGLAGAAEASLFKCLEAYCEGQGPVPSVAQITEAKRLRSLARERLKAVMAYINAERHSAAVI